MTELCPENHFRYEFDDDGHTRCVCTGGLNGDPRIRCPHYAGKCPALGNRALKGDLKK
jgi:hypothetical protein